MADGLAGLRRQLTFEEAARLADVEGPPITYDYAALRLVRSPLFQRMGEKLEEDITAQNMGRMNEVERQNNITNIAMQGGVSRADLEEIMAQMARSAPGAAGGLQPPPPPPPPRQDGVPPPPPPPPTGGVDPPVDPGPRTDPEGGTLPVVDPDPKREAERLHLIGEITRLSREQEEMRKRQAVAQELNARLSASNARDPRQEIIREIHQHHVHPMPVPVPNQNLQDNGPLIELLRNALTSNSSIGRVAEQLGMSMAQITELLKGTTRPRDFNVRPPPKPSVFNIGTPTRDRSRSPPPGDEEMPFGRGQGPLLQTVDPPPPPPTKSTYGPMGRRPLRADPYEPTPQLVPRPKLPSGTPAPETPQVARPKPRPSRAPAPETPQLVRAPSAPVTRAASVPETPVLARGSSVETIRYPSRSRSRALSETPQFQPPARRATLPLADEPETPQLVRGRSQGERTLGPVLEETPQMPERLRRKFEKQTQRAQRQGQLRLELGKFTEQHRARLAAQEAEQRARSAVLKKPSVTEAIQAIERSGGRPADELSPKVRKKSVPIGAFMSRQKTLGGEVRRYKPIGLA